uniref:Ankyrin repeat protein n=1 Tax=Trichogramma kaykai TaxID=54128 RepID=A0ABD2XPH1_9HYME
MALNNNEAYLSRLSKLKNSDYRHIKFCEMLQEWSDSEENELIERVLIALVNCENLFPSVEDKIYFFEYALKKRSSKMVKLIEASGLDIHETRLDDGKSAVHYLAEVIYGINDVHTLDTKSKTLKVMEYFLENPCKNYCDKHGYTYLHAACMSGNATAVNLLLSQGVDVNIDSHKYSPLHIAAQYRHEEIVEILLINGADPNKQDVEKSTPLHALTRLCICQCTNGITFCDKRKPVDKIVQLLIKYGANVEARNRDGDSPLDLAVSRFDVQLVESLLKHGASLDNLNEDKMFSAEFTSTELKNYPLTLNIIEMMDLLKSAGYEMSLNTRLRMIKCWMRVRGNDTDHWIGDTDDLRQVLITF